MFHRCMPTYFCNYSWNKISKWIAPHDYLKYCTCCYHIAGSVRGQHEANTVCWLAEPILPAFMRVHKVRNFWTMSAMESQKAAEDSQNNLAGLLCYKHSSLCQNKCRWFEVDSKIITSFIRIRLLSQICCLLSLYNTSFFALISYGCHQNYNLKSVSNRQILSFLDWLIDWLMIAVCALLPFTSLK